METKYVRVPFEVELAKRIQNKEFEGRIVTRDGIHVRVVCWDKIDDDSPIVALLKYREKEVVETFMIDGRWHCEGDEESNLDLLLEIPEYMTFKDGDILICECGTPFIYKDTKDRHGNFSAYCCIDLQGNIFFDMKGWTYSIKGHANEEQKKIIIEALKESKEPKAKEYLKRFFTNHSNSSNIGKDCEFKPKDWVLTREGIEDRWCLNIFSHRVWDEDEKCYLYYCVGGWDYECIPYNEQTAHLLGTTESYESYEIQITNLHYQKAVGKIACTGDKA